MSEKYTSPPGQTAETDSDGAVNLSLLDLVLHTLDEDKAEDIVTLDLTDKSSIADVMVVASGRVARHVAAMADHLREKLKENGFGSPRIEGLENADWVLLDAGDIIVHIFRPEVRAFYNLEKMWSMTMPEPPPQN